MRIEFENCTLEIAYIGTEAEIFLQRLQCVVEDACDKAIETMRVMVACVNRSVKGQDEWAIYRSKNYGIDWEKIIGSAQFNDPLSHYLHRYCPCPQLPVLLDRDLIPIFRSGMPARRYDHLG
jgi:hypothetical protein